MANTMQKENIENILPLTSTQLGILSNYIKEESLTYHIQFSIKLKGQIDDALFMLAWEKTIDNHETLRSVFRWKKISEPIQIVLKKSDQNVITRDFTKEENPDQAYNAFLLKNKIVFYDIEKTTYKMHLCKLSNNSSVIVFRYHHIILDGWSLSIILTELFNTYSAILKNQIHIPEKACGLLDYSKWMLAQNKDECLKFWQRYLSECLSKTELPFAGVKNKIVARQIKTHEIELLPDDAYSLLSLANKLNITPAVIFYTAWGVLLHRYADTDDVLFGVTHSGRSYPVNHIQNLSGILINTTPLRFKFNKDITVNKLFSNVTKYISQLNTYGWASLSEIKRISAFDRNESLFDSIVVVENYPMKNVIPDDIGFEMQMYELHETTEYDITINIITNDAVKIHFSYDASKFAEIEISQVSRHYKNIIASIINDPNGKASNLEMLTADDQYQITHKFNQPKIVPHGLLPLPFVFEKQARLTPKAVCLYEDLNSWTYGEVNSKANHLALTLVEHGAAKGEIIAILAQRSAMMIIGILAILKSGAAYLPIHPDTPSERIDFTLTDANVKMILTDQVDLSMSLPEVENIYLKNPENYSDKIKDLNIQVSLDDLAYVIYTSGSTGTPKGVLIAYNAIMNRLNWMQKAYPIYADDVLLQKTSISFDVSVWELFWWCLVGASLCLLKHNREKDPEEIVSTIKRNKVSVIHFVPSMLQAFIEYVATFHDPIDLISLRYIFASGEVLTLYQVEQFEKIMSQKPNTKLVNLYGPTEAAVDVSYYNHEPGRNCVPIGYPIDNIQLYIFDKYMRIQPPGAIGELFIGGVGLARGYLNRPEKTHTQFIKKSPFNLGRLYKTGDIAEWLVTGEIIYLGRNDDQVKIRGNRIELGEIENEMSRLEYINEVVVKAFGFDSSKYLCAFFTADRIIETAQIRLLLKKTLMDYMIPYYLVQIEEMPRLLSGKINRSALTAPKKHENINANLSSNNNETQEKLLIIWRNVLNISQFSIDDNFYELGGTSLNNISLMSQVWKEFNIEFTYKEITENPSVRQMAEIIDQKQVNGNSPAVIAPPNNISLQYYPLSFPQRKMFYMNQLEKHLTTYNMTQIYYIEGPLDLRKLYESVKKIIDRHPILNSVYGYYNGKLAMNVKKEWSGYEHLISDENTSLKYTLDQLIIPFDLKNGPVFKVFTIKMGENCFYLGFDIHHIVADGISANIILNEFCKLYQNESIPPVSSNYSDYIIQQAKQEVFATEEQDMFWIKHLDSPLDMLQIPLLPKCIERIECPGNYRLYLFEEAYSLRLKAYAEHHRISLFTLLLSSYYITLSYLFSNKDIVVGVPVQGRDNPQLLETVGLFVITLPIRIFVEPDFLVLDLMKNLHSTVNLSIANQMFNLEKVSESLNIKHSERLFTALFVMQNADVHSFRIDGLNIKPVEYHSYTCKAPLSYEIRPLVDRIEFNIEYSTSHFEVSDIDCFFECYKTVLDLIISNDSILISNIIDTLNTKEEYISFIESRKIDKIYDAEFDF